VAAMQGDREKQAAETIGALHEQIRTLFGIDVPLRLWDGSELGPETASYRLVVNHPWALRGMLLPPSDLKAGEAYVLGDVDIEGDIVEAIARLQRLAERQPSAKDRAALGRTLLRLPKPPRRTRSRRARLRGARHARRRDQEAISFHYDLPHDFYAAFLDPQLVYSCAYFADGDDDLAAAQCRKLDLVCRKLRLQPGMRVLDIGCGWGSLLIHAATRYGVSGVGVTLSETQLSFGRQRVAALGLSDRIELRLQDYRDVDDEFDAVASIGMVEHVGAANLHKYFSGAHRLLRAGGLFLSHGIVTTDVERRTEPREETFVTAYVFPDGELTPAWRGVYEAERAGFELLDVEQLRPHYATTLRHWVRNLERNRDRVLATTGEQDYRIWRIYMAGSAVAFETGAIGVVQLLAGKGAVLPRGREWMLPSPTSTGDGAKAAPALQRPPSGHRKTHA
jgi:cyclopropane-fatty-acyl-phospholipid synthase